MFRSHSSTALGLAPLFALAVRIVGVPSALRKGLSAIFGVGKEATAEATRRTGEDRLWESKFYIPFQPQNGHQKNRTVQ